MSYIKLLNELFKPIMYFAIWVSIVAINIISIYNIETGLLLFYDIIELCLIAYMLYALIIIFFYFISKKENG